MDSKLPVVQKAQPVSPVMTYYDWKDKDGKKTRGRVVVIPVYDWEGERLGWEEREKQLKQKIKKLAKEIGAVVLDTREKTQKEAAGKLLCIQEELLGLSKE